MSKDLKKFLIPVIAAIICANAFAAAEIVFRLEDVRGDDWGAGDIVYPERDDMERGDLDLLWLEAEPDDAGTWFVARFANTIRDPRDRVTEIGQEELRRLARHGFYTFNVDIYIDTDRIEGSGETETLPGRKVKVDSVNAWEKAVILTPRPQVARTLLGMYLERTAEDRREMGASDILDFADGFDGSIEERLEAQYFFPTRIRVRGREIRFFVPYEFFGTAVSPDWGYTALVTGAEVESLISLKAVRDQKFSLMALGVGRGRAANRFGLRGKSDVNQPPVIDLLASDEAVQAAVLSDYDIVKGRAAQVVAEVPSGSPSKGRVDPDQTRPASSSVAKTGGGGDAKPVETAPSSSTSTGDGTQRRTVPSRLRTLNTLREQGLITDEEFQEIRRKILTEI